MVRTPRYALVMVDDAIEHVLLAEVPATIAASKHAWVLASEDDVLSEPLPDMTLLSNPRRHPDDGGD